MAIILLRGCLSPIKAKLDKKGSSGIHLNQKWPEIVKKWASYGHFSFERLRESVGN